MHMRLTCTAILSPRSASQNPERRHHKLRSFAVLSGPPGPDSAPGVWVLRASVDKMQYECVLLGRASCRVGEYKAGVRCWCCPPGTYNLHVHAAGCNACVDNAVCPGGDDLWPVPGYWHSSRNSTQTHKCPLYTTACRDRGESNVARGYTGNLCGSCLDGFGHTLPLKSGRCLPPACQIILYIVVFLVCVVFVAYTVHLTWLGNKSTDNDLRDSDLVKVLAQFLQYMTILGSISAPWPQFLSSAFVAASMVFSAASGRSSLECLVKHYRSAVRLPVAIQTQLITLLVAPVAVLLAVILLLSLAHFFKRLVQACTNRTRNQHALGHFTQAPLELWSRLRVAALVITLFYAYPTMVKVALGSFACLPIDVAGKGGYPQYALLTHGPGYWVHDIQQKCFAGWHRSWGLGLGVSAVLILCIGLPLALLLFLLINRAKVRKPAFREHYGFLYYVDGKLWWEAVWAVQTILLTDVAVFHFSLKAYYSLLLTGFILLLSATVQLVSKPYIHQKLHRLHLASTCLFLNTWLALALSPVEVDQGALSSAHILVGCVMVAMTVSFVAWCVFRIMRLAHPAIARIAAVALKHLKKWLATS